MTCLVFNFFFNLVIYILKSLFFSSSPLHHIVTHHYHPQPPQPFKLRVQPPLPLISAPTSPPKTSTHTQRPP